MRGWQADRETSEEQEKRSRIHARGGRVSMTAERRLERK